MNILVVDDEKYIVNVLKTYIDNTENMTADIAYDGENAILKAKSKTYDCILLDIMMPKIDGFTAIQEIRKYCQTPIIVISAKNEEYDKLRGFDLDIDDYITKPFSPREVLARINAVIKRNTANQKKFIKNDLSVNLDTQIVIVSNNIVTLTKKEFLILKTLLINYNVVVSKERLINEVWGYDFDGYDRTVDTHIKMLRKDLLQCGAYIKTIRGMGYKFYEKD